MKDKYKIMIGLLMISLGMIVYFKEYNNVYLRNIGVIQVLGGCLVSAFIGNKAEQDQGGK